MICFGKCLGGSWRKIGPILLSGGEIAFRPKMSKHRIRPWRDGPKYRGKLKFWGVELTLPHLKRSQYRNYDIVRCLWKIYVWFATFKAELQRCSLEKPKSLSNFQTKLTIFMDWGASDSRNVISDKNRVAHVCAKTYFALRQPSQPKFSPGTFQYIFRNK